MRRDLLIRFSNSQSLQTQSVSSVVAWLDRDDMESVAYVPYSIFKEPNRWGLMVRDGAVRLLTMRV